MEEIPNAEFNPDAINGYYFKVEGDQGKRIAKIEYNGIPLADDASYTNYQIWFHEENNQLDYRYGTTKVNNDSIFAMDSLRIGFIGAVIYEKEDQYLNSYAVHGTPKNPIISPFMFQDEEPNIPSIQSIPPDNRVFKITYEKSNGVDIYDNTTSFDILPNPAQSHISLTSSDIKSIHSASILTLSGRKIKEVSGDYSHIDVQDLPDGIYVLQVNSTRGMINKRLIVSR